MAESRIKFNGTQTLLHIIPATSKWNNETLPSNWKKQQATMSEIRNDSAVDGHDIAKVCPLITPYIHCISTHFTSQCFGTIRDTTTRCSCLNLQNTPIRQLALVLCYRKTTTWCSGLNFQTTGYWSRAIESQYEYVHWTIRLASCLSSPTVLRDRQV
jgi:hypothetical protein